MAKIDRLADFHPLTREAWRDWLAVNHHQVEEALCFGWIDSLARSLDEDRAFTPRKPQKNRQAQKHFEAFAASVKKAILYWLNSAKRAETRAALLTKIVAMAVNNKRANFDKE